MNTEDTEGKTQHTEEEIKGSDVGLAKDIDEENDEHCLANVKHSMLNRVEYIQNNADTNDAIEHVTKAGHCE